MERCPVNFSVLSICPATSEVSVISTEIPLKRYKIIIMILLLLLCALLIAASIISYTEGDTNNLFGLSPIPEIGNGLYKTGMGYVASIKSDAFTRDVLYALEKGDDQSYNQLANNFTQKILALKNDSLSKEEIIFVEAVYFVCRAEYMARKSEHMAGLPLTGFLHKNAAAADRANSDEIYEMITSAKTMTDIQRAHDFGREFLELSSFGSSPLE